MPDIPRDPRQLARDILAGKVRIEDLAKQRQGLGGQGGRLPPPQQQARVPNKIPLPRPAMPRPAQPAQRAPAPVRQVLRPAAQAQQTVRQPPPPSQPALVRRPLPTASPAPVARPAAAAPRTAYTLPTQAPSPIYPEGPLAPETMASAMAQKVKPVRTTILLAQLVRGKDALKHGILMSEVLGKPVSMRDL